MWHKPCRTFHPWCLCIKTRCLSPYIQCSVTRQVIRRWIRDCLLYNSQIALAARPLTKWCLRFQITLYHYCSEFGIIIGCQGRAPISEFLSVLGRPDLGWLMAWHCMVPGQHQLRPGQDYAQLWLVSKVYPVKVQLMWYGILEKNHIHSDFGFMGAEWVWVCVCTYVGTPRIECICTHDMPREWPSVAPSPGWVSMSVWVHVRVCEYVCEYVRGLGI